MGDPFDITNPNAFIDRAEARRRLGVTRNQFMAIMRSRRITQQKLPGVRGRVLAADIDRLMRESTVTCSASA